MQTGIVYVATGKNYREECALSAQSVNEAMPAVPITVFTDQRFDCEYIDQYEILEDPKNGSYDVIKSLPESPYEKTIYFDTDIYVDDDISGVFEMLTEFDLCVVIDPIHTEHRPNPLSTVPDDVPEYNSGFIAYRKNEKTTDFFEGWLRLFEYQSEESADQPPFRDALYYSDLKILTLPPEYNCLYGYNPGYLSGPVKVFHGRLVDKGEYKGLDYAYDPETIRGKLNETDEPRVYTHSKGFEVNIDSIEDVNRLLKLFYLIQRDGYVSTANEVKEFVKKKTVGRMTVP